MAVMDIRFVVDLHATITPSHLFRLGFFSQTQIEPRQPRPPLPVSTSSPAARIRLRPRLRDAPCALP
ncbi:hypothetical protein U9M48_035100 [Paspalum notatum var. saurae]|uniref:Uncharacterized protein n=1 Tax=Paspalum notatum var. saurae TaxID=547442 RepID=A0AAQ3X814_PASNO